MNKFGLKWTGISVGTICSLLCLSAVASAQTPVGVPINTPYQVAVTASPGATGIRFYLDTVKQADVPVATTGDTTATLPAIPTAGSHKVSATAYNSFGESAQSAAVTFQTGSVPNAPGVPKILLNGVQVAADGTQIPIQIALTIQPAP